MGSGDRENEAQLGHVGTEEVAESLLPALEKQSGYFSCPMSPVSQGTLQGIGKV